jgi:hypothetical protein
MVCLGKQSINLFQKTWGNNLSIQFKDKKAKGNLVITGCPMRPTESLKPGFEFGFQVWIFTNSSAGNEEPRSNLVFPGRERERTTELAPGLMPLSVCSSAVFLLITRHNKRAQTKLNSNQNLGAAGARWVNFQSSVVHADGGIEEQALGDVELLVQNWLLWDRNPLTRRTIEDLVEKKDLEALSQCMRPR